MKGPPGKEGPEGAQGQTGKKGSRGVSIQGPPGMDGNAGPRGETGQKGEGGFPGPAGNEQAMKCANSLNHNTCIDCGSERNQSCMCLLVAFEDYTPFDRCSCVCFCLVRARVLAVGSVQTVVKIH